ncbi:MAG: HAD-IIIA family hydrolase [Bacteroidetes bacterium]|nr:MAG: HAD-IIIA family hydrolase [Bacteroidota bacterium]
MNKALFLDRDGILNIERGEYTYSPDHFQLHPSCTEILSHATRKNYLLFVISNQSGIAKGIYEKNNVEQLHRILTSELQKHQIQITDFLYCPHHPDVTKCLCRKPGKLLFEKIIARYNINTKLSYMLGDKMRDIIPAIQCGIKGICIDSNADYTFLKNIL